MLLSAKVERFRVCRMLRMTQLITTFFVGQPRLHRVCQIEYTGEVSGKLAESISLATLVHYAFCHQDITVPYFFINCNQSITFYNQNQNQI